MKHLFIKKHVSFFVISLCIWTQLIVADCCSSTSSGGTVNTFIPRSTSVDLMRQVVGVQDIIAQLQCNDECWPGYIGVTAEFTKTFNALSISQNIFGPALLNNGCCQAFNVSGSSVTNRSSTDLLADNFGLPVDFQSTVNINPCVTNFIGDLQGYLRLDRYLNGLYFYIHAPITNTKWNLHVCEDIGNPGEQDYPLGYFGPGTIGTANLLHSFTDYISGQDVPTLSGTTPLGASFTESYNALEYARFAVSPCGSRTKSGLADLRMWLGYDWFNCERYSLGIGVIVAAPTGNKPDARYVFNPVIGNGHFWELGGLVKADGIFWQNCDGSHRLCGFTQANFTHMFRSQQQRTFDLQDKPLSRYMLAAQFEPNGSSPFLYGNPLVGETTGSTLSDYRFAGTYAPVANLTTFCVDVSVNIQIDWVAMLTYSHHNLSVDLGYELWYRGCEKVSPSCDLSGMITPNTWALKGDASMFGFAATANPNLPIFNNQAVALGATESDATIFAGTNAGLTNPSNNPGIDNAEFAVAGNSAGTEFIPLKNNTATIDVNTPINVVQTRTSIQSVFLTGDDVNVCNAQTKGFSNKLFLHASYAWDCVCWNPYLGAGAMGEFSTNGTNCNSSCSSESDCTSASSCTNVAFSQWGVWIKGGFVF